ncbi:hypothetical protein OAQ81_01840 [Candidatus Thioglobus sp.]|nr:hypothetical protein [Candidatus Thioglobus sp.]
MHDPTRAAPVVIALKRMHRQKGRAQKQALPLTNDILQQLLGVCANDLAGQRNRVLLHLGHETCAGEQSYVDSVLKICKP